MVVVATIVAAAVISAAAVEIREVAAAEIPEAVGVGLQHEGSQAVVAGNAFAKKSVRSVTRTYLSCGASSAIEAASSLAARLVTAQSANEISEMRYRGPGSWRSCHMLPTIFV